MQIHFVCRTSDTNGPSFQVDVKDESVTFSTIETKRDVYSLNSIEFGALYIFTQWIKNPQKIAKILILKLSFIFAVKIKKHLSIFRAKIQINWIFY